MFERLIEWVEYFFDLFRFWKIINPYEAGVVLRLGKYSRTVRPGFNFILPINIETVLTDNVVPTTTAVAEQVLTTADGVQVVISIILRWRIHDIRKILLEVEDADGVLVDCSCGELAKMVRLHPYAAISTDDWHDQTYKAMRKRAFAWGIELQEVQVVNCAKARTIRIAGMGGDHG